MLNSGHKKEDLANLKVAANAYKIKYESTINSISSLYELRLKSVQLIKSIDNVQNELEIIKESIKSNYKRFENEIKSFEVENKKFKSNDKSAIGAGVLAGSGVALGAGLATFGPGLAMAIATTFGTASTGVAISTLSGAAATTSALAWLGGGMASGTALLGAFGPIGWAIGGAALAGSGLWANSKNKKVAKEAEENTFKIKNETRKLSTIEYNVNLLKREILELEESIKLVFYKMRGYDIKDYKEFNDSQLDEFKTLLNNTFSLSCSLGKKIN